MPTAVEMHYSQTGIVVPQGQPCRNYVYALIGAQQMPVFAKRLFAAEPYRQRFGNALQPSLEFESLKLRQGAPKANRAANAEPNQIDIQSSWEVYAALARTTLGNDTSKMNDSFAGIRAFQNG